MRDHPPDRRLDPPEPTDEELRRDKLEEELSAMEADRIGREVANALLRGDVPIHEATLNLNSIRNILRDARFTEDEVDELTDPISKCLEVLR